MKIHGCYTGRDNAPFVNSFKNRLDKHWSNQDIIIYNWHDELSGTESSSFSFSQYETYVLAPIIVMYDVNLRSFDLVHRNPLYVI